MNAVGVSPSKRTVELFMGLRAAPDGDLLTARVSVMSSPDRSGDEVMPNRQRAGADWLIGREQDNQRGKDGDVHAGRDHRDKAILRDVFERTAA